jgi:hypothetical protein
LTKTIRIPIVLPDSLLHIILTRSVKINSGSEWEMCGVPEGGAYT